MLGSTGSSGGLPAFHVHPGHAFEGFELIERPDALPVLVARCGCGRVLDAAEARFTRCPDCDGNRGRVCARCGSTGRVIDHATLEWRISDQNVP